MPIITFISKSVNREVNLFFVNIHDIIKQILIL